MWSDTPAAPTPMHPVVEGYRSRLEERFMSLRRMFTSILAISALLAATVPAGLTVAEASANDRQSSNGNSQVGLEIKK